MRVYWTKELTHDKKNAVEIFCKKNNLRKEWKTGPNDKGHYNLIDLDDREQTREKILNFCTETKIKTTDRSNNVAAMSAFKNGIYNIMQEGASFGEVTISVNVFIRDAEKKWHGKIDKNTALAHIKKEEERTNTYWREHSEQGRSIFSGNGKVLLVGAYASIDTCVKRLTDVAVFLEGIIDEDCLVYKHKGNFYFYSFGKEKTNLMAAVKYFKQPLLRLLNQECYIHEEIFSFDKDDFMKALSSIRLDENGGFKVLSKENNVAIKFLKSNGLF